MKLPTVTHDHLGSTLSMVGGFVTLLTIIQICRTFYTVFVGPMSKYPGPKLAKATRLVFLWHKLRGNGEKWIISLHEQYGDIVQTAPGQLSYATGHAWKDIYGFSIGGKTQQFPKDPKFYGNRKHTDIIYSNDADHTRIRRNLAHAFSDRALRQQEPLLRKYVDQLIEKLKEQGGDKLNIVRWYNYTTFDIMGDLTFGEPLGNLSGGEYTPWVKMIFASIKVGQFLTEMKFFPWLSPIISRCVSSTQKKDRAQHIKFSEDRVDARLAKQDARPDIWGIVMNAKEEQRLTLPEMHSSATVLMLAGTETTATLLSGLTYLLLTNPDKMEIVRKEIRETFSSPEEINIDSILKLKYVNACFEEALRCYPPVPGGLPRVVPKGGDFICGQFVPEETRVSVNQISTYRNPNNFHRPLEFLPERWLGDAEFDRDEKSALQPFSVGPRNCIGKNLAYLEMRLIFSNVLWNFDINLCEESRNWTDQHTYLLWEKNPLMVTLDPVVREK